jgi:hypothetical protein
MGWSNTRGHGAGAPQQPQCRAIVVVCGVAVSRRFAHAARCQCHAIVVVCRFAGFATFLHMWLIVKSLIVPYLVFRGRSGSA